MKAINFKQAVVLLGTTAIGMSLATPSLQAEPSQSVSNEASQQQEYNQVTTSSQDLMPPATASSTAVDLEETPAQAVPDNSSIAQEDIDVEVGRPTRSGPSYVGVGLNIGLGDGDTALGETSFSVISKIGILPYLSVRPAVLVDEDPTILLPVTFDFLPLITEATEEASEEIGVSVSPYVGAGIALSTEDDLTADFLATGGVDVPIFDERAVANLSVSASLFDNPAVGLLLGIGYAF